MYRALVNSVTGGAKAKGGNGKNIEKGNRKF